MTRAKGREKVVTNFEFNCNNKRSQASTNEKQVIEMEAIK